LIISKEAEKQINFLCKNIPDLEWSGNIYYTEKGQINDADFEITVQYIHLMKIDKQASFEWEMDNSIIDLYIEHPEYETMSFGLIHSHCDMGVFFSATDIGELEENAKNYRYYLSVVTNNRGHYTAKVIRSTKEDITTNLLNRAGDSYSLSITSNVLIENDCEIYTYKEPIPEYFEKRYKEVQEEKKKNVITTPNASSYSIPKIDKQDSILKYICLNSMDLESSTSYINKSVSECVDGLYLSIKEFGLTKKEVKELIEDGLYEYMLEKYGNIMNMKYVAGTLFSEVILLDNKNKKDLLKIVTEVKNEYAK